MFTSDEFLAPLSWQIGPCRLSASTCSIYSQSHSTPRNCILHPQTDNTPCRGNWDFVAETIGSTTEGDGITGKRKNLEGESNSTVPRWAFCVTLIPQAELPACIHVIPDSKLYYIVKPELLIVLL